MAKDEVKEPMDIRKKRAIEMMVDPDEKHGRTHIAETVGVSRTCLYNWLRDREFIEELCKRSDEVLMGFQPTADRTLRDVIENRKDVKALRLYYEKQAGLLNTIKLQVEGEISLFSPEDRARIIAEHQAKINGDDEEEAED